MGGNAGCCQGHLTESELDLEPSENYSPEVTRYLCCNMKCEYELAGGGQMQVARKTYSKTMMVSLVYQRG